MKKVPLILQHKDLIFLLTHISPKLRKEVLQTLKKREIDCISEIFSNFLKKRLTIKTKIINKLKSFKNDIRIVALKKTPIFKKKAILLSKRGGSILSLLLPLAASVLTSLISR